MISELKSGFPGNGVYLIKDAVNGVTTNGLNYLTIVFQDKSGTIEGKMWEVSKQALEVFKKGNIVKVDADVILYKDKLQLKVYGGKVMDDYESLDDFIISSPIPISSLIDEFNKFKNSIKQPQLAELLDLIFKKYYKQFISYPAAMKNHHEFMHGLIHHSVSMARLGESIAALYLDVDRDLLISGCLLHDIGKVIELTGPVSTAYTLEGTLLGHISIGFNIIKQTAIENNLECEEVLLLEHMILSHHGKLEYGSPVLPRVREALLLSMIDDLDSKMMILDKALDGKENGEFSDKISSMDFITYYKK